MDLETRLDDVGPGRERELLAQREVAHAEVATEADVGEAEAGLVARRVGAAGLVAKLRVGGDLVAVTVRRNIKHQAPNIR